MSHIRGKSSPGGGVSKYKGPGVGPHLPRPRSRSMSQKQILVLEEQPGGQYGCSSASGDRQVTWGPVGKSLSVFSEPKSSLLGRGRTSSHLVFNRIMLAVVRRIMWGWGCIVKLVKTLGSWCSNPGKKDNTVTTTIIATTTIAAFSLAAYLPRPCAKHLSTFSIKSSQQS